MNQLLTNTALAVHNITKDTPMFAPERLAEAGKMILLGMGAVFSVLAILWAVLAIFKIFSYDLPKKRAQSAKKEEVPEVVVAASVAEPVAEEVYDDDGALIAVIAAAVAAYRASEGITPEAVGGFRVVSFRRVNQRSAWNSK